MGQGHICGAAARWGRRAASALVRSRHVATYDRSYGNDDSVKRGARSCILGLIVRFPNDFVVLSGRGRKAGFFVEELRKGCGKRREEVEEKDEE